MSTFSYWRSENPSNSAHISPPPDGFHDPFLLMMQHYLRAIQCSHMLTSWRSCRCKIWLLSWWLLSSNQITFEIMPAKQTRLSKCDCAAGIVLEAVPEQTRMVPTEMDQIFEVHLRLRVVPSYPRGWRPFFQEMWPRKKRWWWQYMTKENPKITWPFRIEFVHYEHAFLQRF